MALDEIIDPLITEHQASELAAMESHAGACVTSRALHGAPSAARRRAAAGARACGGRHRDARARRAAARRRGARASPARSACVDPERALTPAEATHARRRIAAPAAAREPVSRILGRARVLRRVDFDVDARDARSAAVLGDADRGGARDRRRGGLARAADPHPRHRHGIGRLLLTLLAELPQAQRALARTSAARRSRSRRRNADAARRRTRARFAAARFARQALTGTFDLVVAIRPISPSADIAGARAGGRAITIRARRSTAERTGSTAYRDIARRLRQRACRMAGPCSRSEPGRPSDGRALCRRARRLAPDGESALVAHGSGRPHAVLQSGHVQ